MYSNSFDSLSDLFCSSAIMSAVYTKKINGLNIDPCGTPVSDFNHSSTCVFTSFSVDGYSWNLQILKSKFSDIPALCNLYSAPSLQTESNAPF